MKNHAIKNTGKRGFTLLELSIVLVIIGLIVGSVVAGQSILGASHLQTVITDVDSYTNAVNNFKQAYQSLPGDFANANALWGSTNGNGDGMIGSGSSYKYETFTFWQHLYQAKMLTQSLSGAVGSAGGYDSVIGSNVPAGSITGGGFSAVWIGTPGNANSYCSTSDCFPGLYGNVLQFGGYSSGKTTQAPILSPASASSIDTKIDDGFPATGKVRAMVSTSTINPGCTTTAVASTAAYNTSSTAGRLCSLIFVMGF